MERYYCFEIRRHGRTAYIGKSLTTEDVIRKSFPRAIITGNLVTILEGR